VTNETGAIEALDVAELSHGAARLHFRRPWAAAIDRAIGAVVEPVAALLVAAEVVILSSGVFMRYVVRSPLVWSDELASILLLWLAMLGAVIAYRRGEHIRMTALLRRVSPQAAAIMEAIGSVVVAIFVIELMPASLTFVKMEQIDVTPALGIPSSYVVMSIIVGLSLILVLALLKLSEGDIRAVSIAVGLAVVISAVAWFARPEFANLGNANLVIFFVGLVGICVAIGVPIAFSFGIGTLSYLAITTNVPLSTVASRMNEGISNLVLLAVPLFIFLGLIMESSGIARRLVGALAALVGHLRGGLNMVLVAAMYLVSGISGSKIADMAAVAPVLFPDMERRGHKRTEMISLLATSGAMAETIPPSLVLIIIGSVTGVSIGALFTAGLLPAGVCALFILAVAMLRARTGVGAFFQMLLLFFVALPVVLVVVVLVLPAIGLMALVELLLPKRMRGFVNRTLQRVVQHLPGGAVLTAFFVALPGLALPVLIRYFVVGGIATATEVSVVGIIYTLLVGFLVYRQLDWRVLYPIMLDTVSLAGAILLIIATATSMGWALTQSGFAQQLAVLLGHAPGGAVGIMLLSIVMFVVLGSVLEGIPAMVLFGPLLFPVAKAAGINEVHYAIVAVLAMGVGLFSPPLGVGFYAACAIGKANPDESVLPILPYLAALILALVIIALVPWISLAFLPKTTM
jgi:TRAP-type C4-dicarboxylate transport system permease large subunit/TRAP-type C4-dicarboxylate transport system permease small subunit